MINPRVKPGTVFPLGSKPVWKYCYFVDSERFESIMSFKSAVNCKVAMRELVDLLNKHCEGEKE